MAENVLYYGDNLDILRRYIRDETIDLIYLDPPFFSNRYYEIIWGDEAEICGRQLQERDSTNQRGGSIRDCSF